MHSEGVVGYCADRLATARAGWLLLGLAGYRACPLAGGTAQDGCCLGRAAVAQGVCCAGRLRGAPADGRFFPLAVRSENPLVTRRGARNIFWPLVDDLAVCGPL